MMFFYSSKYKRACSKLGFNNNFLDKHEIQMMMDHADMFKEIGKTPEDGAISIYEIIMPDKLRESPDIFMPIAIVANHQIIQWVCERKISHQRALEVGLKISEAFSHDE